MSVYIDARVGHVSEHLVRRVSRSPSSDWCAELFGEGPAALETFDYHPSVPLLHKLRAGGAEIADDVLSQGAEGADFSRRSKPR